jgi:hypothetical protein
MPRCGQGCIAHAKNPVHPFFCSELGSRAGLEMGGYDKNPSSMSLRVARGVYNPEKERFHYYVSFKPTLDPTEEEAGRGVERSYAVEVAISVTETGELADLAFTLPQTLRSRRSLEYLSRTSSANLVEARVFVTVPGLSGDSVLEGRGSLEVDGAGRIMGLEIS